MKAREYRDAVNAGKIAAPKATATKRTFTNARAYRDYMNRTLTLTRKVKANVTWYFMEAA